MSSLPIGSDVATQYQFRADYVSATLNYYGLATPGAATSDAVWQIRKETLDSNGRTTLMQFGGSSHHFNQVWDNRATTVTYG